MDCIPSAVPKSRVIDFLYRMPFAFAERVFWYLNIAAAAGLMMRLYTQGLSGIYRIFLVYLAVDVTQQVLELVFISDPNGVGWIYVTGQALKLLLAVFVVLNLYGQALDRHPALAHFGHRILGYFFGIAAGLSALGAFLDTAAVYGVYRRLRIFLLFERSMDAVVLALLVCFGLLLLWFPVRIRRNVALYICGFVIYSFERWAGLLLVNLWPQFRTQVNIGMLAVSFVCLMAWSILLRSGGESATVVTGRHWNGQASERLIGQLDAINIRLARLHDNK